MHTNPYIFPRDFWQLEHKYRNEDRSFCPLFQHKEMTTLAGLANSPEKFTSLHVPLLLYIPFFYTQNGTLGFANSSHFLRLFNIIIAASDLPDVAALLEHTFAAEWANFLLLHSLD